MWYRQGSVTVTNGSNVVNGAGTDFVSNASIGDAFVGPDGRSYEIAQVVSATDLRLVTGYQAATGGGQGYAIQPTQSFARDLALAAAALLNTFAAVRDGVGQGLFSDGSAAAPGIRFFYDQDTGFQREAENAFSAVVGGARCVAFNPAGAGFNTSKGIFWAADSAERLVPSDGTSGWALYTGGQFALRSKAGVDKLTFSADGSTLSAPTPISLRTLQDEGAVIMNVGFNAGFGFAVYARSGPMGNAAATSLHMNCSHVTGRSINAGGTGNFSGSDYAEYMTKASGCGAIAKGDVCGVDRDGRLTKTWADAISFVVKSTDPSLVGGDTWAAHLPPRPEAPDAEPQPPALPTVPAEDADDAEIATYRDALAAYPALVAQYRVDHDAWAAATAAYERDLPAWEADLEAARQCVDRIAFCGQVPCNVSGDFEVGDYIVAAANGAGIEAVAVKLDDMTMAQYARRIGKVWAIRDGRAWIDVQHG